MCALRRANDDRCQLGRLAFESVLQTEAFGTVTRILRPRAFPIGYDNTTFLWNGKGWRFAYEDDSAENYILANMSYDKMSGLLFCYGGSRIGGSIGRAETWDGSTWTDLGLQPAGARSYASFAHDPDTSTSLLFGGFSYAYESSYPRFYDDTWQLKWEK
ncbi:MAG TPA: hypothetical protein VFG65_08845 [Fimbriimonadales bacterium]|nr:hypothetical protein [Fimbriimonadales bacterium]